MPVFAYIVVVVEIITVIVGGLRYRSLPRSLKFLEWLIAFNVAVAGVEWTLANSGIYNLWVLHLSTLAEYIILFLVFFFWMENRLPRLILRICLVLFVLLWIVSKFSFEPFWIADDLTATVSKVIQIAFSTQLLVYVVKGSDVVWADDPRFWTASGTIIYSAGSLFIFAMFNKMLQVSAENLMLIWYINWALIIVANLLYLRGFLCRK